eukprot:TRINITY_DN964_c1_g1_i17.p1 TRINITY_DN964_c1_g1~~TRINITY_DN964_c1_g1_i17.p1  ORF type:complete len:370 (+),score=97.49 TRINITY_DN964_c1_g1_i17:413-1522(+)
MRVHVRRLELLALMIDTLHAQITNLQSIKSQYHGKTRVALNSEAEETINKCEREIAKLQDEVDAAKRIFNRPVVPSSVYPPSPVLATHREELMRNAAPGHTGLTPQKPSFDPQDITAATKTPETKDAVEITPPPEHDLEQMSVFVNNPIPKHVNFKCRVTRSRSGFRATYHLTTMNGNVCLLSAVKKASLGSHFSFHLASRKDKEHHCGDLRSAMGAHAFHLTDHSEHRPSIERAVVYYKIDYGQANNNEYGMKMKVIIPTLEKDPTGRQDNDLYAQYKNKQFDSMLSPTRLSLSLSLSLSVCLSNCPLFFPCADIHVLANKQAVWVPALQSHILQYSSQAITKAAYSSVKNFQLVCCCADLPSPTSPC